MGFTLHRGFESRPLRLSPRGVLGFRAGRVAPIYEGMAADRSALAAGETGRALRRGLLRAVGVVVAGLTLLVAAAPILGGDPAAHRWRDTVGGLVVTAGVVVLVVGLAALVGAVRMWWCLRRWAWRAWSPCRFREVRSGVAINGSPTLLLTGPEGDFVLTIVSLKWRWAAFEACDGGEVWFAGAAGGGGGVAAPPGGTHLVWARRPWSARRRERLRRRVVEGGEPAAAAPNRG